MNRLLRHLLFPDWLARRWFSARVLASIEHAIAASERGHAGELCFVVEAALHPRQLFAGMTARARAVEVFSNLRIWDTAANNGVLIYLLLADRDVEIIADRGFNGLVEPEDWAAICADMEASFRRREFAAGALLGIERVDGLMRRHFPLVGEDRNELPDKPRLL